MKLSTKLKAAGVSVIIFGAFAAGMYMGVGEKITRAASSVTISLSPDAVPNGVDFTQFWRAWNLLDQNFVETHASSSIPNTQKRLYGAIAGLTNSFGDPYTTFFPPAEATTFTQNIQGQFGGVGMELGLDKSNNLVVIAPLKDSPAEKAGIKSGDIVVGIGTSTTEGLTVDNAVSMIRGPISTPIDLSIVHASTTAVVKITIVRDTIQIPIIKDYLRKDGIYEIELYSFSANSADLFRTALRNFMQSGSSRLILDLRGNPGGYLDAAVNMASYFLPQGDIVVTEDYKGKQDNIYHRSLGFNVFAGKNLQMAILIDQGSASASEILSGALQQHNVAKLVGTRSFGKGSVQQLMDLGNGAQIKITVARWLTPNGSSISDGGLQPDIKADRTQDDYNAGKDPQTDAAVKYLLGN